ncbi:MAG: enoyl-CoA hydratase/isomerase family protein, partial [Candidatus Lambdaproteobacteria bacterium]|nr:enoyl-CoA hydratase/isomerase family protein [Candidatus Lambdaproteobacteria bacterium]
MRYEYETLKVDQDGMILNITMNRPERLNAVNPVMHEELSRIWEDVGKDESVRVAVITGAGRA